MKLTTMCCIGMGKHHTNIWTPCLFVCFESSLSCAPPGVQDGECLPLSFEFARMLQANQALFTGHWGDFVVLSDSICRC